MSVRKLSLIVAGIGLAVAPVAHAAAAPVPARIAAPVTEADEANGHMPLAVILVLVVVILAALAGVNGDGEPDSP
jgi:hypothetical protein